MTVVVLDQMRTVTVVQSSPSSLITVSQTGMQGPQGNPTTVNGHTGAVITLTAADVGAIATTARGSVNGVASLDGSGLVPYAQLPVTTIAGSFMDLSTNQTVATGIKTFSVSPIVPTPTTGTQAANKSYADLMLPLTGGTMTGAIVLAADPVAALQPATKQYVDGVAQGLTVKGSVVAATTGTLPANTYANGTSGVGATLTATANAALAAQDGTTLTVNQSLLVKNEATAANNGIYTLTQVGDGTHPYILTRRTDNDQAGDIPGAFVFVETGTVNAGSGFVVAGAGPYTVGTTAINWTQFSGAGEITAGSGLTKSGNTLSITAPVTIALGGTGSITQNFVDLTTAQSVAGAKTFSAAMAINTGTNGALTVTGSVTGQQLFRGVGSDITTVAFETEVTGDTVHRFVFDTTGRLGWGPGSGSRDTNLYRNAAGVLKTDTAFVAGTTVNGTTDIQVNGASVGRGYIVATVTANTNGSTGGATETLDTVLNTLQFSAISGRRYQVGMNSLVGNGAAAADRYAIRIRDSGSSSAPTTASTMVAETFWVASTSGTTGRATIAVGGTFVAGSTGTHTIGMFSQTISGTGPFTPVQGSIPREMYVEDLGPV